LSEGGKPGNDSGMWAALRAGSWVRE